MLSHILAINRPEVGLYITLILPYITYVPYITRGMGVSGEKPPLIGADQ